MKDTQEKGSWITLAEGEAQSRPRAIVPVKSPYFIGNLLCIVSDNATNNLLIGNYNGSKHDKIGGCRFEKVCDDRVFKERYERRILEEQSNLKKDDNQFEVKVYEFTEEDMAEEDYVEAENDTDIDHVQDTMHRLETKISHTVEKNSIDAIDVNNFSNHEINHNFPSEHEQNEQNKPNSQGERINEQIQDDFSDSYEQQENDDSTVNNNQDKIGMVTTRGMRLVDRVPKGTQIQL